MATSSKLFSFDDVKNKPSRSGFDLSRRMAFTAKISELLPVCVVKTFPGDSFVIKTQHFTRTSPVQTAAFVRIREYFDWFFVPYRQLWRNWQSMSTNMLDQPVTARGLTENSKVTKDQPYMMLQDLADFITSFEGHAGVQGNQFGFNRGVLWAKLFNYFGYGRSNAISSEVKLNDSGNDNINVEKVKTPVKYDIPVDIFPVAAYHKIYNDFFRNSQWEHQTPYLWNFDYSNGGLLNLPEVSLSEYWNGKSFLDMEYCNVPKDLFFGVLPNSQLGDVASVSQNLDLDGVSVKFPDDYTFGKKLEVGYFRSNGVPQDIQVTHTGGSNAVTVSLPNAAQDSGTSPVVTTNGAKLPDATLSSISSIASSFSILQLRQTELLQKYKEIAQSGDQSYRDQIYKIWGISLPDELSDTCQWISGDTSNIDISEVINTNFSDAYNDDGSPVSGPYIKGKGVGVGEDTFNFSCKEHGVILCLYHAQPVLDYDISGIDLQLTHTNWDDYPNPAFDKIGFETLPVYAFSQEVGSVNGVSEMGYVPRYISAKTAVDRVCGGFSFGLNDWVAPITDDYITGYVGVGADKIELGYNFFKIHPNLLDSIFGLNSDSFVQSDQFRVNSYFDIKVVRNFDYNGLPY